MTSHPKDLSDDLINAIRNCHRVSKHIHLPIQSGSTRLLKIMNRNYSKERYLELMDRIKSNIPDIAITTDIIVGFPGETENDFSETLDVVERVEFDSAFTFIYSPRKGTPASNMEDQIDEETKHKRFNRLVTVLNKTGLKKNKLYENKTVDVLVEGTSKNDENKLMGRTDSGKLVNFTGGNLDMVGNIIKVNITEALTWSLNGKLVE
jgi:tRNA-2-methylthio-N6-dimethylallyladenosine synthase